MTDSRHNELIAPNRPQRDFSAALPNRIWVADTTYRPVIGGFLFLVIIIDLFSRRVVGWSLGDRLDADLSGDALHRALDRRNPPPGCYSTWTAARSSQLRASGICSPGRRASQHEQQGRLLGQ